MPITEINKAYGEHRRIIDNLRLSGQVVSKRGLITRVRTYQGETLWVADAEWYDRKRFPAMVPIRLSDGRKLADTVLLDDGCRACMVCRENVCEWNV